MKFIEGVYLEVIAAYAPYLQISDSSRSVTTEPNNKVFLVRPFVFFTLAFLVLSLVLGI